MVRIVWFATFQQILHQLTARALIRDWDEGSLHEQRTGHEVSDDGTGPSMEPMAS